jgi:hypothetical protein
MRSRVNVARGVGGLSVTYREVTVKVNPKGSVTVVSSVFSPK